MGMDLWILFSFVVGVSPQVSRDDKNAVLMDFGEKKLKFDQNGLTWFMITMAVW